MASKTWFITGTSSGFGRSLVEQLLAQGDRVAATARKTASLDDLKARYPELLWVAALDVTDTPAVRRVVGQAFAALGRIDVVVNNAGYGLFGAIEEVSDEQIAEQINTNVIGSMQVIRAALPHLRAQGGGRILQLSSMGGQIAFPALGVYHATKWAVEGMCESLMGEVAPFNIQVTLVEPGGAPTQFGGNSAKVAQGLAAYEATMVGAIRKRILSGQAPSTGDTAKMAAAMIDSVELPKAPKRLTLGRDAYKMVRAALAERIEALDAQKDIALSTDAAA